MGTYFLQSPIWLQKIYPTLIWKNNSTNKNLVLTFDDGPHPTITKEVLTILKLYEIKAYFFCVGENVKKYPEILDLIRTDGHQIGNHTLKHEDGWQTNADKYFESFVETDQLISSAYFRPPYGKITRKQIQLIQPKNKIVMWSRLSADFDTKISKEKCLEICLSKKLKSNEIILFHDSEKAYERMIYALPKFIEFALQQGFSFELLK